MQAIAVLETVIIIPPLLSGIFEKQTKRIEAGEYTGLDADSYFLTGLIILMMFVIVEII